MTFDVQLFPLCHSLVKDLSYVTHYILIRLIGYGHDYTYMKYEYTGLLSCDTV
jgi:hypothetical protein